MHHDGNQHIRAAQLAHIVELLRHHSNHRIVLIADADRLPDQLRVGAELPVPDGMAQHDYRMCAWSLIFFRQKPSADAGMNAHDIEEIPVHELSEDADFCARDIQLRARAHRNREAREHIILLAIIL